MTWKLIVAAGATLAAACTPEPAAPANDQNASATNAVTPVEPADPVERRYDQTMSGQPLALPPAGFQLVVTRAEYASRYRIPCHKHPYPRYVYIQQGNLRVHNYVTNRDYDFGPGDTAVESIDQWHEGVVTSAGPLILVALEQVPRGDENRTLCATVPPPR